MEQATRITKVSVAGWLPDQNCRKTEPTHNGSKIIVAKKQKQTQPNRMATTSTFPALSYNSPFHYTFIWIKTIYGWRRIENRHYRASAARILRFAQDEDEDDVVDCNDDDDCDDDGDDGGEGGSDCRKKMCRRVRWSRRRSWEHRRP